MPVSLDGIPFRFWLTPEGVHVRRKGSPVLRTKDFRALMDCISDQPFECDYGGRHYSVWRVPAGLRIERTSEQKLISWQQVVEWMDGQKILPL